METVSRLFVIGASAGGHKAIASLLRGLPENLHAAFVVVIHSSFDATGDFSKAIQSRVPFSVMNAEDGLTIEAGKVYLSRANYHLYVEGETIRLVKGPQENLLRPSIDVLFRSAAVSFGNRCVGILLTGRLSDGTAGLAAIKKCVGLTLIQNPDTAEFGDMPAAALQDIEVDYIYDLDKMPRGIGDICRQPIPPALPVPEALRKENAIATAVKSQIRLENSLGEQVPISCASCGGPLWKMKDPTNARYRCHVGHSFSQAALIESQDAKLEGTLWASLRTFEEKRALLHTVADEFAEKGRTAQAEGFRQKADEITNYIALLQQLIQATD